MVNYARCLLLLANKALAEFELRPRCLGHILRFDAAFVRFTVAAERLTLGVALLIDPQFGIVLLLEVRLFFDLLCVLN